MATKAKARIKFNERALPAYTRGEELFHMISHIAGGAFAGAAMVVCLVIAAWRHNAWSLASGVVYGTTLITLYTMSSIYHGLIPERPKKIFRVIDHCAIFFLIAGSYTPIALGPLRERHPVIGWALFAFIWACCAMGTAFTAVDLHRFQVFSMICYIGMGWCLIVLVKPLLESMPLAGFLWLMGGGLSYTIGSVLYGLGKKRKYMHSVFHVCVLIGSALHFVCVLKYLL